MCFMELDLDSLEAVRVLGSGATGTVFLISVRSSAPSHTSVFALKVVEKQDPSAKPDAERRARWELSVLSRLTASPHPFLPSLLGSADTPDLLAWAIPFCPCGNLHSLRHSLSPDRIFSTAAIRFYLSELLSALAHLHSLGIVYRDLKPENILLRSNGHIVLTDFDLSRHLNPRTVPTLPLPPPCSPPTLPHRRHRRHYRNLTRILFHTTTPAPHEQLKKANSARVSPVSRRRSSFSSSVLVERSHSFVGTEEYVSPEVVRGDGHEFAVDWWAMGILAYEMAYGHTPFRGRNRKETFRNVLTRHPEFVGTHQSELKNLIAGLLTKDPTRRLGYAGGAMEIKEHPFFRGVRWDILEQVGRPPFLAKAEEIEEEEGRSPAADGFNVRDYFKKMTQQKVASVRSTASMSLTEF